MFDEIFQKYNFGSGRSILDEWTNSPLDVSVIEMVDKFKESIDRLAQIQKLIDNLMKNGQHLHIQAFFWLTNSKDHSIDYKAKTNF